MDLTKPQRIRIYKLYIYSNGDIEYISRILKTPISVIKKIIDSQEMKDFIKEKKI